MAAITGHSGSCTVGGSAVATAKIWSVDITVDTADVTTFASAGWKENAQTLRGWTGNITVVYDGGGDAGEAALITGLTTDTEVALVLLTSASGTGTAEKFTGNAVITSMGIPNDVNGIIEVSFGFTGSGVLTPTALV